MNPSTGKPLWCNMNQWLENLGQRAVALGLDADQTREYMDANIPDKWSIVMSGESAPPSLCLMRSSSRSMPRNGRCFGTYIRHYWDFERK